MDNISVIVVGAFHEIIELLEENQISIKGLIDNNLTGYYRDYPILGTDSIAMNLDNSIPIIITPDIPKIREKLVSYYSTLGYKYQLLISKQAKISKSAKIGDGTIVQYGVNISSEVIIGKFVKCNTLSNVMHNSKIGDYTTIAPNAVILGNVSIGERCYIGANATILPNIMIGDDVTIGAGSVITKDVGAGKTVYGVPGKEKITNKF